ncbi:hypothetical protein AXY43_13765 [Clostridium sp. MF28]|uniref:hypothetical protein n=1 Tax=Clostridium TaxID=1485 RepID=UPI000CF85838|nr:MULTISPECIES: hypothetical protein [Clostridium]AVK49002.1 hypothetical protein AXY43_13765 [Clostridium sp. MF28]PSM56385.1 hypothetical protein C4L39_17935 [Clostridium diolis]
MNKSVILRYDKESFINSCIDGYKVVIKKKGIRLDEVKLIRNTLEAEGYYVEHFKLDGYDTLEVQGGMDVMPCVESMHELVKEVKSEESYLIDIFYNKLKFIDVEISLYLSGLY